MIQADLVRRRIMQMLNSLRIYISCLPEREEEALKRLHGSEGMATATRIAENIMQELGHAPTDIVGRNNPTVIAARKAISKQALK